MTDSHALECGAPVPPTPDRVLEVTGDFPAAVEAGAQLLSGTVAITARQPAAARGVVTPQADVFLVRDGRVATLPLPRDSVGRQVDLSDGGVETLSAYGALVPCGGGDALPIGAYEVHVLVVLNHDDGSRTESLGGPWPLTVH